jgi:hypothetical protein
MELLMDNKRLDYSLSSTREYQMSEDRAAEEYVKGLTNITLALIEGVDGTGITTISGDISYVPPLLPGHAIPEFLQFKIAPRRAPVVWADFTKVQIADCCERIGRSDVKARVRAIVGEYQRWHDVRRTG